VEGILVRDSGVDFSFEKPPKIERSLKQQYDFFQFAEHEHGLRQQGCGVAGFARIPASPIHRCMQARKAEFWRIPLRSFRPGGCSPQVRPGFDGPTLAAVVQVLEGWPW